MYLSIDSDWEIPEGQMQKLCNQFEAFFFSFAQIIFSLHFLDRV